VRDGRARQGFGECVGRNERKREGRGETMREEICSKRDG